MTHKQTGTEPAWLAEMTMCGNGMKKGDTKPPPEPKAELYNLKADIGEQNNLIDSHADIAQRLAALMAQFDKDLEKTSRPAGQA